MFWKPDLFLFSGEGSNLWNFVFSSINEEQLERIVAPVYKTEINDHGGSAALTTRHPSIHKFGTKFRRTVAVTQSV
jgi:hypothetical protein